MTGGRPPGSLELPVLVVEDDPLAAEAHAQYVDRAPGFRTAGIAHSLAEARRFLDRGPVALILLDLYLPDGHGLQLCRALRAARPDAAADIFAVTSARDLATVRQAAALGVVQYLLKPFGAAALHDRLARYARYRESLAGDREAAGQHEVDQVFAALRPAPERAALPKGLSEATLSAVARALRGSAGGLTAAAAAETTGVSRITARRYLEHLVSTGQAVRTPQYGTVGRPELCYRPSPS
ncbi:response regulator [Phaeacidiphilus oryzae]|uniref:response regulator n=1 Tax=Phaeacidiphilus oryzae TaxID=348818 RepID=UPI0005668020|nr:response regulator [Phaeacidiphilus oryzae]